MGVIMLNGQDADGTKFLKQKVHWTKYSRHKMPKGKIPKEQNTQGQNNQGTKCPRDIILD